MFPKDVIERTIGRGKMPMRIRAKLYLVFFITVVMPAILGYMI